MYKSPAIGIDLGTTYSCVAVYRNGNVEVIANESGNRTTPSWVAFTDKERYVGEAAVNQYTMNPYNTVYGVKRIIGRSFDDPAVQSDIDNWPYTVVNVGGKPKISVHYKRQEKEFNPEEISAMILGKMKETAEEYLGMNVTDAVITVPAYFNGSQRQATVDAGKIAGLNVLRIINEPTAAALAYGLDKKSKKKRNVLIYDLGGGTFDVSLLTIEDGDFQVKCVTGDTHLGGEDFNNKMVDYLISEFVKQEKNKVEVNKKSRIKLQKECEIVKRSLSAYTQVSLTVESFFEGKDFTHLMTRRKFEELNLDLFRSTLEPLENLMKDSGLRQSDIDDIVLVGGSTRIPKIQNLLQEFFKGKELSHSINPDEAVARGAAIQAAILNGDCSEEIDNISLLDVNALSLGIETRGGYMTELIHRNSPLPIERKRTFSTAVENQTAVHVRVFEGERVMTQDNHFLGDFILSDIPLAPSREPKIEVTFNINEDGILNVSAMEKKCGLQKSITICNDSSRLSAKEIENMINDAKKYKEDDDRKRLENNARYLLESRYLYTKRTVSKNTVKLNNSDKLDIMSKCEEVKTWLEGHSNATLEELQEKLISLQKACEKLGI